MINDQLLNPRSIAVVGASDDVRKPGGKILKNIIDYGYKGTLYAVNPKATEVQGIPCYPNVKDLPPVDLAILAIPASMCTVVAWVLAAEKGTKAFIIISAGFSEENTEGASLEHELVEIMEETGSCLIGPNCIGVITTNYAGCFSLPVPKLDSQGVDFISASGATAVFIMEAADPTGLTFSSVFSVGNSAQIGVEEVLEYLDMNFDPVTSSRVKLLYMESVRKPGKLLKHAASLIRKGCRIAAIKAGHTEAGSRAASSHTGAMATPDTAVDALFRKAGIVRCNSRSELVTMGCLFMHKKMDGNRMAIITHAGGPAVMLTDILSDGGMVVPAISGPTADGLLAKLYPGSSVVNPIDVLATGTVEQMDAVIECVDRQLDNIDGMCIIFGSPGLVSPGPVYSLINEKMKSCTKPIYPIFPSAINARQDIADFLAKGRINFFDEVLFGQALAKAYCTSEPAEAPVELNEASFGQLRNLAASFTNGYLPPLQLQQLFDLAGISRIPERVVNSVGEAVNAAVSLGFPVVMKVAGPIHKTDVGGVLLDLSDQEAVTAAYDSLIAIPGATGVLVQPMLKGRELFVGAKKEGTFGHLVMIGLGGIFIEIMKDIQVGLAPLNRQEVVEMIGRLKGRKLLDGVRGQDAVDTGEWAKLILSVSNLVSAVPEIAEMDLNPVMGLPDRVVAVDARIRIEKV